MESNERPVGGFTAGELEEVAESSFLVMTFLL